MFFFVTPGDRIEHLPFIQRNNLQAKKLKCKKKTCKATLLCDTGETLKEVRPARLSELPTSESQSSLTVRLTEATTTFTQPDYSQSVCLSVGSCEGRST